MKLVRSKAGHIIFARSRSKDLVLMLTSRQLSPFQRLFTTIRSLDLLHYQLDLATGGRTMAAGLKRLKRYLSLYLLLKFRMFIRRNTRIRRAITLAKVSLSKFDESGRSSRGKVSSCDIKEITMITTFVRCKRKKQL